MGDNCSVECQCNKHSNCRSVTETTDCVKCENNTMVGGQSIVVIITSVTQDNGDVLKNVEINNFMLIS